MKTTTRRCGALAVLALLAHGALGQVVTDGSVGAVRTLTGPTIGIPDSLGLRMGPNLLHSFSTFNIRTGESAVFVGLGGIENIIARITGGTPSAIQGSLRSSIPGSNLFLINPAGVVFGPNASINVPGSFHASTAHYLRLADGTRIAMSATPGVTLTFASPAAFGFEGAAAPIVLSGAQLRVAEGRHLSLSGGDIWMGTADNGRTSVLSAPSGAIGVVAAQSAGEAVIDASGLRAEGFGAMGSLTLLDRALVSVTEGPGRGGAGAISLTAGNILIDHANVESRTVFQPGRGISISATDALTIDAGNVLSVTRGAGAAGALTLTARDVTLSNGALVDTSCDPGCTTGAGGTLRVNASRSLTLLGNNATTPTFLVSNSFGGGRTGPIDIRTGALSASGNAFIQGIALSTGDGSAITIASDSISLTNGAQIDASTRGTGRGGNISVANTGDIRIEGSRIVNATTGFKNASGIVSNTEGSGAAGQIVISTANLSVLSGGEISSSARLRSSGAGGRIAIAASGTIRVAGVDADGKSAGIVSNTFATGNAGSIELRADRFVIEDRGRIQVQSEGAGLAGAVQIRGRTMSLRSQGQVSSDARSTGDGGVIDVELSEDLLISGANSGLFAKTYGPARGGSIRVTARDVLLSDGGGIYAGSDLSDRAGPGGDIFVQAARNVDITTGGSVTVETKGPGQAGSITLAAGAALTLSDDGRITAQSENTGRGGSVAVSANTVDLRRNGRIAAEAISLGIAGTVNVVAADSLTLVDGGRITTAAPLADGGDVNIVVGRFAYLGGGRVTTAVGSGQGGGGNITFRVPTLLMNDGVITANAFGGPGGNIRIGTTTFVPSANSKVTASSTLGVDGTITLESPAIDPSGELLLPPASFLDAGAILAGRCGPRLAGRASSLVVAPAANVADAPDGWRWRAAADPGAWSQPLACVVALAASL